jgi:hypothetical protein
MALSAKNRAETVELIGYEADFERSGISGRIIRDATACPRQGEMPQDAHKLLLKKIGQGLVRYVVFSYTTPIAWVLTEGLVTMPEIKYSATTSQHQKMVRDAFGDRVNSGHLAPFDADEEDSEVPVALSENEEIILRRMRDEYGTEYTYCLGGGMPLDGEKFAPRDQVEPLIAKGLVQEDYPMGAKLTDAGRAHLDKIAPVASKQAQVSQYAELTEDELIELASDLGDRVYASGTAGEGRRASLELVAVVGALKARREVTAPARRRIGEYLRQQGIVQAQYEKDISSTSDYARKHARQPEEAIHYIHSDEWVPTATLRLSDLQRLVTPVVRDTKAEFFAEQEDRLEEWKQAAEYKKLPEKQKAVLECVVKGHIVYSYRGWKGDHECCRDIHGATMNSLTSKRHIVTTRSRTGVVRDSKYLMLKRVPR